MKQIAMILWLTFAWAAFYQDVSWANLVGGLLVGIFLVWLYPLHRPTGDIRIRPLAMVKFLLIFGWSAIRANLVVAWEVLTPNNRIREGIVGVEIGLDHPLAITMISHAINLAPGTMVIEIDQDPCVLYVHALHLDDPDDVRAEVEQLERLVADALGLTVRPTSTEVSP